jgi:hypothetical protein
MTTALPESYKADFPIEQLIGKVREIAAENPDFIYQKQRRDGHRDTMVCYYVAENSQDGSCIMGRAFRALGVPAEVLRQYEGERTGTLIEAFRVEASASQLSWLFNVQCSQDDGLAWGECVRVADRDLSLFYGKAV